MVAERELSNASAEVALEVRGIAKRFTGTLALDDFSLSIRRGEVRALLGKNGAGKTTLVKILSGVEKADAGTILVAGEEVDISSVPEAQAHGIATVHQDLGLLPDLTVRDNLTLGQCPQRAGVVLRRRQREVAVKALVNIGLDVDQDARLGDLGLHEQQLLAIGRALLHKPHVLILDEPTSSLQTADVENLLRTVRRLASDGVAVIYVSHRLDEIPLVADSVTVIRDGQHVCTESVRRISQREIVEQMMGHAIDHEMKVAPVELTGSSIVELERVTAPRLNDVSLRVLSGEVLGIWGMPGAGRTEVLRTIFGLDKIVSGSITINGKVVSGTGIKKRMGMGLGFCPEDRKREGLVMPMGVAQNLVLTCLQKVSHRGLVDRGKIRRLADTEIRELDIKVPGPNAAAETLSGGNQQKVVVGKWLAADARILLLDEPTKGVDVETKAALYRLLRRLSGEGMTVLVVPTEVEELFSVCDRIIVMRDGRVVSDVSATATTTRAVMGLAMGEDGR
jgi:simple sugar transport system ATP-binding protein